MKYFTRTPAWMRALYKDRIWKLNPAEKTIYLTFDDGPNPAVTPFILEKLKKYNAKATFFCVGENVKKHPDLFQEIFDQGHRIGNHTQNHLNGWKTDTEKYVNNVLEAKKHIPSSFFRPPYGKIKNKQVKALKEKIPDLKIVMWDILSGDSEPDKQPQTCLQDILFKFRSGSIIVLHDSEKAWERMSYVLPRILEHFNKKGFKIAVLPKNT